MWDSLHLFVAVLVGMLGGGTDAKDTGRPFEIGKKPDEKLVFVPGGTDLISFSLELGNKNEYKDFPSFELFIAGQELYIGGILKGGEVYFSINDDSGFTRVVNPSQLTVTSTGFVINGAGSNKYESKTPVQFEEAKDEQDAKYFSIKLSGEVPPNFVIKGLGLNEYVIGKPEPTSSSSTAEPASETTTSASNGRDATMIWLALVLTIGSIVSQVLFSQRV